MAKTVQYRMNQLEEAVQLKTDVDTTSDYGPYYFPPLPQFLRKQITRLKVLNTGIGDLGNQPEGMLTLINSKGETLIERMPLRMIWTDPTAVTGDFGRTRLFDLDDVDFKRSYLDVYQIGGPIGNAGTLLCTFIISTSKN